jgi:hypothetical protein
MPTLVALLYTYNIHIFHYDGKRRREIFILRYACHPVTHTPKFPQQRNGEDTFDEPKRPKMPNILTATTD